MSDKEVRYKLTGDPSGLKKAYEEGTKAAEKNQAAVQKASQAMAAAHDQALRMDAAMVRSVAQRAAAQAKASEATQRSAMSMAAAHEQALRMDAAMGSGSKRAAELADATGKVATKMAAAGAALNLPAEALRTLDDVAGVAELGLNNLGKSAVGLNAATAGVVGAGLALGTTIGGWLRDIPAVEKAADGSARAFTDWFGKLSTQARGAVTALSPVVGLLGQMFKTEPVNNGPANFPQIQTEMAAHQEKLLRSATKGMTPEQAKEFLGLSQKKNTREQIADDIEKEAAATKKATEAAKQHAEELKRLSAAYLPPQEEADKLVEAFEGFDLASKVTGLNAFELAAKLRELEAQGAKLPPRFIAFAESVEEAGRQIEQMGPTLAQLQGKEGTGGVAMFGQLGNRFSIGQDLLSGVNPHLKKTVLVEAGTEGGTFVGKGMGDAIKKSVGQSLQGLPQVIMGAIQGGGNIGQAIGAHLGQTLGTDLGKALGSAVGGFAGKALGSVVPVVGTLLGGALGSKIGGFFGKLFGGGGPSKEELAAQKAAIDQTLKQLEQVKQTISQIRVENLEKGVSGIAALFKNMADQAGLAPAEIDKVNKKLDAYKTKLKELNLSEEEFDKKVKQRRRELESAAEKADLPEMQERADRLGLLAAAMFQGLKEEGLSTVEAFEKMGPALDEALKAAEAHGVDLNGTLGQLAQFRALVAENEDLVSAAEGIGSVMDALRSTGQLNQTTAGAAMDEIGSIYDELIEKGFTAEQSVTLMAQSLFDIKKAAEEGRIQVDEQTQSMIDLADQSGAFEGLEDPMDAIVDALEVMNQSVAALVKAMGGELPEAVRKYIAEINNIPGIPVPPGTAAGGAPDLRRGTPVTRGDLEGMAEGGVSTGPTSGYPRILHGSEGVIPLEGGGAGIIADALMAQMGAMSPTIHVAVQLGERTVDEFIIEGFRGNRNGLATETNRHLGGP